MKKLLVETQKIYNLYSDTFITLILFISKNIFYLLFLSINYDNMIKPYDTT